MHAAKDPSSCYYSGMYIILLQIKYCHIYRDEHIACNY